MRMVKLMLILLLFSTETAGQATSMQMQLESLNGPTPMSWMTQRFLIHKDYNSTRFGFGLETQSAISGNYGGFYVFGVHGIAEKKWKNLSMSAGVTLATGGGAGAPDGDGFMYRLEGAAKYAIGMKQAVGISISALDFPSGNIYSLHPALQWSYTMPYKWQNSGVFDLFYTSISLLTGVLFLDENDASRITTNGQSLYAGVRFSQAVLPVLDLDLQLGASAVGATDGFMDYKAGITWLPVSMPLQPYLRLALGSGGGGSMRTAGGLAVCTGLGLRMNDRFELGMDYWNALETRMGAPFLTMSARFPVISNFGFINKAKYIGSKENLKSKTMVLVTGSRINLSQGTDRNGLEYEPMGALFLGGKIPMKSSLWLSGETLWAATGGYGAYAEGMFGVYHDTWKHQSVILGWNGSVIAAGGGGINVGKGAAIAAGVHLSKMLNKGLRISAIARYKYFGMDAYNPWTIGIQLEPSFQVYYK